MSSRFRWFTLTRALAAACASVATAATLVAQGATGSVKGKITDAANGQPLRSAQVFVVGTRVGAASGADGTFTLSTLPPGSYKLYAWEEVEQNAWMDPEFRRPFEALGTNATVKDGAGPNVTLKVIGREQVAAIQ